MNERKITWKYLQYLPPDRRVHFLSLCGQLVSGGGAEIRVTESTGTANDVFLDLMMMTYLHGLKLKTLLENLATYVRRWEKAGRPVGQFKWREQKRELSW